MSAVSLLLQAEAAAQQRAVRATAYRHRHLADRPLVVCAYNLSGEAAAPLALIFGTRRSKRRLVVSAEPRNRDSRFEAINAFAADFHAHISTFLETETRTGGQRGHEYEYEAAIDAPQIIVPNRATRDYLGARLGRSLRYLGLGTTHPVPETTLWTGAHLSWLAEHAHRPGQSVFLSATELLGRHFVTGQSAFEDENLATLLAWINNQPGSGLSSIQDAEQLLPFGPVPDPVWEAVLEPMVRNFAQALRADDQKAMRRHERAVIAHVRPAMEQAYEATFDAIDVMRRLPMADTVRARWSADVYAWSAYCRRTVHGIPRFRTRHDARRAAHLLDEWSRTLEQLEADEAYDDPMVMAEADAAGQCLTGTVTSVDAANREVKPGNVRASLVPLITVRLDGDTRLLPGQRVAWSDERGVHLEIRAPAATRSGEVATLAAISGHDRGSRLPRRGSVVLFSSIIPFGGPPPTDPDEVPWTHRPPAEDAVAGALIADLTYVEADDPAEGTEDGSPDLTADELLALPLIGLPAPEDVPPVVL